jgi:hypothetical protein
MNVGGGHLRGVRRAVCVLTVMAYATTVKEPDENNGGNETKGGLK